VVDADHIHSVVCEGQNFAFVLREGSTLQVGTIELLDAESATLKGICFIVLSGIFCSRNADTF